MKQKFYYSISNGGDGSASIQWMESVELAQWHQDRENEDGEGWAEDCSGSIELESDSPILFLSNMNTKYSYLIDFLKYSEKVNKELLKLFYGVFSVKVEIKDKNYYNILVDDKIVCEYHIYPKIEPTEETAKQLEDKLNTKISDVFNGIYEDEDEDDDF